MSSDIKLWSITVYKSSIWCGLHRFCFLSLLGPFRHSQPLALSEWKDPLHIPRPFTASPHVRKKPWFQNLHQILGKPLLARVPGTCVSFLEAIQQLPINMEQSHLDWFKSWANFLLWKNKMAFWYSRKPEGTILMTASLSCCLDVQCDLQFRACRNRDSMVLFQMSLLSHWVHQMELTA